MEWLSRYNIILVSGSPRRKELLEKLGVEFIVDSIDVDESYSDDLEINEIAVFLANKKFNSYLKKEIKNEDILITADTIVIHDNIVLGKPKDLDEARIIIEKLSDSWHKVITGVCIGNKSKTDCFSEESKVYIEKMSNSEIDYYVNNHKVLDKAGAYGIQDWLGLAKISKIEGSYFNIMGLPTQKLYEKLKLFSIK